MVDYVPEAGDLVWLEFDPQAGREQAGRRPAIVVSPRAYNAKSGLALMCPITSKVKGYPFEVPISGKISGVILADQIRSLDYSARRAELIEAAPAEAVSGVRRLLLSLIDPL